MTVDDANVLVVGEDEQRVDRLSRWLAGTVAVRPLVTPVLNDWSVADVDVVLFADAGGTTEDAVELPTDTRTVVVLEEPADYDPENDEQNDHVLVEPLLPDNFRRIVQSVARQVRYDRRLRECAELAAELGRTGTSAGAEADDDPTELREEVATTKAELDDMVAKFTDDDFRQAFQAIAAD